MRALGAAGLLVIALGVARGSPVHAEEFFEIDHVENRGRAVAVEFAELNGDALTDLLVVALLGIPPDERRIARVYLQKPDGSLPGEPDHTIPVPQWSAAYEIADVKERPGQEMVLLRPKGLTLLSLADASAHRWHFSVPGPATLGLADDERGFNAFRLVYRNLGPEPWLLVPQIGQLLALSPEGAVRARLEIPRRASFFIAPRSGLAAFASDLQVFVDAPRLSVGEVDGDGRADLVFSTRHELWVYLSREDGSLPTTPDRRLALGLVTPRDHVRGSGGVASVAGDIDGDGKLDLLISHWEGSFSNAVSTTYVHMNRGGEWNLDDPDHVFRSDASLDANALLDLDADDRPELVRLKLRLSLLEVVEFLLTREIDIQVRIHRYHPDRGFEGEPWVNTQVELPFSFDTYHLEGFMPTVDVDLNADGFPDLVSSGGGKAIEIALGGGEEPFSKRCCRQELPTAGEIRFGDLNGDGLLDLAIFDPHHSDVPVRLGRNRGRLPGTRGLPHKKVAAEVRDSMPLPH
jgi:hypothetical protein